MCNYAKLKPYTNLQLGLHGMIGSEIPLFNVEQKANDFE